MNKNLTLQVNNSLLRGDLSSFRSVLSNESFSFSEAGYTFNLFCERQKKIKKDCFFEAINVFAETIPDYFFSHLNRLCYTNSKVVAELLITKNYLQFERLYTNELIEYIKLAYYYCSNEEAKSSFLDKLESVSFLSKKIIEVIEELNILFDIEFRLNIEVTDLKKQLDKYSWDLVLYSLCVFIEEYRDLGAIQSVLEDFINQKSNGRFYGKIEDYFVFINCLRYQKKQVVSFSGKRLESTHIKKSYGCLKKLFNHRLYVHQIDTLVTQYCLENNLVICEKLDGEFDFELINIAKETCREREDIKMQVESQYYDMLSQDIINKYNPESLMDDSSAFFQINFWKSYVFLESQGLIKSGMNDIKLIKIQDKELPLNFPITYLQGVYSYSNNKYSRLINRSKYQDAIAAMSDLTLQSILNLDSSGIPFNLINFNELKNSFKGYLKDEIDCSVRKQEDWDNTVSAFVFDKSQAEGTFSLDEHTHILIDGKCFGFRAHFPQKEPSYLLFNKLLANFKDKESNQDTSVFEEKVIDLLLKNEFYVLNSKTRSLIQTNTSVEYDILCYKSGYLFMFEVKSTKFRQSMANANLHINRELMKAAHQQDRNIDVLLNGTYTDRNKEIKSIASLIADNLELTGGETPNVTEQEILQAKRLSVIVSTSFEADHQIVGGYLKISHFELVRILANERDRLFYPFLITSFRFPKVALSSDVQFMCKSIGDNGLNHEAIGVHVLDHLLLHRDNTITAKALFDAIINENLWSFMQGMPPRKNELFCRVKEGKVEYVKDSQDDSIIKRNSNVIHQVLGIDN